MRPKKKTRRKMGHRQELTRVMVKSISLGKSSTKSSPKKETVKQETKPKILSLFIFSPKNKEEIIIIKIGEEV